MYLGRNIRKKDKLKSVIETITSNAKLTCGSNHNHPDSKGRSSVKEVITVVSDWVCDVQRRASATHTCGRVHVGDDVAHDQRNLSMISLDLFCK